VGADMNERLKELAEQAGATVHKAMHGKAISFLENDLERFAELILNDEPQNSPKWEGMKPIDGELRIKAGIKLSHKDPYCMEGVDMARGKMYSPLEALQNYADLIREDEANGMRETYMKMIHDAIADEREACAALCDDIADRIMGDNVTGSDGAGYCVKEIRAISNNRIKTSKDICGND
jgi:hypothetical protein